ncbi:MAG: biotin-dependent carboxyltransferase [Alteromonadaceae bacterium]|nr:biotin-dependent carboxyltransferase [Alteromonadaceae bacterium]
MKYFLTVLKANGLCSIQDLGRLNAQHLGFSAGGAADEHAFLAANYLLNNKKNDAALEITLGQISFRAGCCCTIAITGADCNATINDKPIENWQVHQLTNSDVLQLQRPHNGLQSYIAVVNGVQAKEWLGSRCQTLSEIPLGFNGDKITQGSFIKLSEQCNSTEQYRKELTTSDTHYNQSAQTPQGKNKLTHGVFQGCWQNFYQDFAQNQLLVIRFIPGKLWSGISKTNQQQFCSTVYTVSANSNRMGYRLVNQAGDFEICEHLSMSSMELENTGKSTNTEKTAKLSKPVNYGAIQIPENGQPIILMKERQTIGGYPVLGSVIQTDLFRLSQKRPGEQIRFEPISLERAQQQLLAFYRRFL